MKDSTKNTPGGPYPTNIVNQAQLAFPEQTPNSGSFEARFSIKWKNNGDDKIYPDSADGFVEDDRVWSAPIKQKGITTLIALPYFIPKTGKYPIDDDIKRGAEILMDVKLTDLNGANETITKTINKSKYTYGAPYDKNNVLNGELTDITTDPFNFHIVLNATD